MFRQGIKGRYLHKHATFLWLSLCLAIFLSSLPQKALFDRNIFSCSHELDQSLQPVQTQIGTNDSIPFSGWVLSAGKEGQPLSFLSRIRASNRIPFRLPIPELWFSVLGLCFALWQFVFLQRLNRQRKDNHIRNFLIRYIHNQNGETYRQVLF